MSDGMNKQARRGMKIRPSSVSSDEQSLPQALLQSSHSVVQMQRIIGNRAMSQMIQRKMTTTTLSYSANATDGVDWLTARIGRDDLWSRGTSPAYGKPSRITKIGYPIKTRYVGGHMLNQEFGGLGDADNMIVQSDTSNKGMNKHDNILKRLGTRARQLEDGGNFKQKGYEYYAIEDIVVNAPNPDGSENYADERHIPESITVTISPEKRSLSTKKVYTWTDHGETINNPYVIKNVPPYPSMPNVVKPKKKTAKQIHLANITKLKSAIKKPGHKYAHKFKAKHFRLVKGIGLKKATSLENYFSLNPTALSTLLNQNLTGLGFNKSDVNLLMYNGLK